MKRTFQWLIILSGVYDLLLGGSLMVGAPTHDAATQTVWATTITLGAFLVFSSVLLIWAAQDLYERGSIVAWQGLVRLVATGALFHAIGQGFVAPPMVGASRIAAIIDLVTAAIYFVALIVFWRWSILDLLLGRKNKMSVGDPG